MEPDDLKLMLEAARLEWERWCNTFVNLRAQSTTGKPVDELEIDTARNEMKRALADYFDVMKRIDSGQA